MSGRSSFRSVVEALQQPAYGPYVAGNIVSLVGNWMQRTAVGWHAWTLTGSAGWVGAVAFADLAPALLIGPFGGVLADRFERRHIMLVSQTCLCLTALALWLAAALDRLDLPMLLLLVGVHGLLVGLNQPARLALIPSLVPMPLLPAAVALNSIVFNAARFLGPATAGVTIAKLGLDMAFLLNALSYLGFILVLTVIRPLDTQVATEQRSVRAALAEGLAHVRYHPAIGPLFLLFIGGAIAVRPLGELLPGLAGAVFHGGVETLALLSSSLGLGAVAGGVWIARRPPEDQLRLTLLGHFGSAIAVLLFLAAPNLSIAVPLITIVGFTLVVGGVAAQTLLQLATVSALRGRVMSLFGLAFRGGPAIGALAVGTLGDRIGLRLSQALAALAFVAFWGLLWRKRNQLAAALTTAGPIAAPPNVDGSARGEGVDRSPAGS